MHLGYVAATGGKPLLANPGYVGNGDILPLLAQGVTRTTFSVDGAGKPILLIDEPQETYSEPTGHSPMPVDGE